MAPAPCPPDHPSVNHNTLSTPCRESKEHLISENDLWKEIGQLRRRVAQQKEQIDRQEQIILLLQDDQGEGDSAQLDSSSQPNVVFQQQLQLQPQLQPAQKQQQLQQQQQQRQQRDPTKLSKLGEDDD